MYNMIGMCIYCHTAVLVLCQQMACKSLFHVISGSKSLGWRNHKKLSKILWPLAILFVLSGREPFAGFELQRPVPIKTSMTGQDKDEKAWKQSKRKTSAWKAEEERDHDFSTHFWPRDALCYRIPPPFPIAALASMAPPEEQVKELPSYHA